MSGIRERYLSVALASTALVALSLWELGADGAAQAQDAAQDVDESAPTITQEIFSDWQVTCATADASEAVSGLAPDSAATERVCEMRQEVDAEDGSGAIVLAAALQLQEGSAAADMSLMVFSDNHLGRCRQGLRRGCSATELIVFRRSSR